MTSVHYQYHGESLPISSLTSDNRILEFAGRLHRQAKQMEQAREDERHFDYKPIVTPQNLRHTFGS